MLDFCICEECRRGDALPLRRQGIPGARQLALVDAAPAGTDNRQPRGPQRGLEGLGLFDQTFAGANQPSLF
ncbi:hypothetical protein [Novosphingobium sp.]|uniref:hypothetical protein n=1 Tax=Novosphingobium sp. TaxID=1874826 RepID=UPI00286E20CC|nr:hypothetical protein [Novosphingobium sp.]